MKLLNVLTLFVLLTLFFSVTTKSQENNEILPLPIPSDDEVVCGLTKDILFFEVSVFNGNSYVTNLEAKDFEIYYENDKQDIDFFTLGEISLKSDVKDDGKLFIDSNRYYLIGLRLDIYPFDEKFRKSGIKVNISEEKRTKLRNPKIETGNFLYQ